MGLHAEGAATRPCLLLLLLLVLAETHCFPLPAILAVAIAAVAKDAGIYVNAVPRVHRQRPRSERFEVIQIVGRQLE